MERTRYGSTGLEISRLCLGTGHFAGVFPTPEAGADLLERAFHAGVTFWDTAEGYRSHPHVGAALRRVPRQQVQVQTKTGAVTCAAATASIEAALRDLGTDYLDVLLLHGVNSPRDYAARAGALEALLAARAAGKVRHVGCSTHIYTGPVMETVTAAPEMEVILATVNKGGVMLEGSIVEADEQAPRVPASPSMEEHIRQVRAAYEAGKGISIMKIIGGGRRAPAAEFEEWIRWAWDFPWAHALNLGICRPEELETDLRLGREHAARACRRAA